MRTSLVASETKPGAEARDTFYGLHNGPSAPSPAGGVVGGAVRSFSAAAPRALAIAPGASTKASVASPATPLGLRYSVREAQGGPAQLVVESNADAVLYIFRRDETGAWLPVAAGGASLKAHTPTTTPGILTNSGAPAPRAVLILSRAPLAELAGSGAALNDAIERLRAENTAAPLVTTSSDGSIFVVTPQPAALLVAPLPLP